jgi:hypothetical protein
LCALLWRFDARLVAATEQTLAADPAATIAGTMVWREIG